MPGKVFALFFALIIRIPIQIRLNALHPLFTPLTDVMIEGGVVSTSGTPIEMITGANPIMLFAWAKDFFKLPNPCGFGQQFPFPVTNHWLHLSIRPHQSVSFFFLQIHSRTTLRAVVAFPVFFLLASITQEKLLCICINAHPPPMHHRCDISSWSVINISHHVIHPARTALQAVVILSSSFARQTISYFCVFQKSFSFNVFSHCQPAFLGPILG